MEKESLILEEIKKEINVKENLKNLTDLHEGIFHRVVNSYFIRDVYGLTKQDIINQKLYIFWQAAIEFDKNKKTRFSTWLGNFTFYFLSKEYNKIKEFKDSLEITENLLPAYNQFYKEEKIEILDFVLNEIQLIEDKRIVEIFELRYFQTTNHKLKTWKEIGNELNLTGQACLNLHNKGVNFLKRKLKYE